MSDSRKSRFRRIGRVVFRWVRVLFLIGILAGVLLWIYLNQFGLPDTFKRMLLSELNSRGLQVEFERLRLRWYEGIVAESVTVSFLDDPNTPQIDVAEAVVQLDGAALRRAGVKVTGLTLENGDLLLPLVESNRPNYSLTVENVHTGLRFLPDGSWQLSDFSGQTLGVRFQAQGVITNGAHLRELSRRRNTNRTAGLWQRQLRDVAQTLSQFDFQEPPVVRLHFSGDARSTNDFHAALTVTARGFRSDYGAARDVFLSIPIRPDPRQPDLLLADVQLSARSVSGPWGSAAALDIAGQVQQYITNSTPARADLEVSISHLSTARAGAGSVKASLRSSATAAYPDRVQSTLDLEIENLRAPLQGDIERLWVSASMKHGWKDPRPESLTADLNLFGIDSAWASIEEASLSGTVSPAPLPVPPSGGDARGFWKHLAPYVFSWHLHTRSLRSDPFQLDLDEIHCAGAWTAPRLHLNLLNVALYEGSLNLAGDLNVDSREFSARASSDFDVHGIRHLLSPNGRRWLGRYTFAGEPPQLEVSSVTGSLPEWPRIFKKGEVDWKRDFMPAVKARGRISAREGAFRGFTYDEASADVRLADAVWHLPNLTVRRPEGRAVMDFRSDALTKQYHFDVVSGIDPKALRDFLETAGQKEVLDDFELSTPPVVRGDVWGRWRHRDQTGIDLEVSLTNFVVRGVAVESFTGRVLFTNDFVDVIQPSARAQQRDVHAAGIGIRTTSGGAPGRIFFTNVVSHIDPLLVTRAIGPKTTASIEPYRFLEPPLVRLNGSMPLKKTDTTDLLFDVRGGPFQWWNFRLPHIAGYVHWVTNRLYLTNMTASFYSGNLEGGGSFDFQRDKGAGFQFALDVTNANFATLVRDLFSTTKPMSGTVSGRLEVTSAETGDFGSWDGSGSVIVEDGRLWSIPLFGFMSGTLDSIAPGLGKSPIKRGTGTFTMTNSTLHTEDLELRCPAMRLQFRGDVTHQGAVDATLEAELLRDQGVLGQLVGALMTPVTKLFVYKLSGTITEPEREPLYIPRILRLPFLPLNALRGILDGPEAKESTGKTKDDP